VKKRVEKRASVVKENRFMELEGLRGIAAVIVVIFHFLVLFYPVLFYSVGALAPVQHFRLEENIHGTPLLAFLSGTFSVAVFFVLSGFVLSVGFFSSKDSQIIKRLAAKRYLRLMLPALASILIALFFIKIGFSHFNEVREVTQSSAVPLMWSRHPDLFTAIYEGLVTIFVNSPVNNFNPALWTMKYEFIGSFMVFGIALLFAHSKWRWLVYLAVIVGTHSNWYLGFILGMMLADLYVHRREVLKNIPQPAYAGILILGICMGAFPRSTSLDSTIYGHIMLPWLTEGANRGFFTTLGALCIVIAAIGLLRFKKVLSGKLLSQLGKYTYSLYLVHQPLVYVVGTSLFMVFLATMGYNKAVLLAFLCTVPVIALATVLFHRFIELPSIKISTYSEEVFSGRKELKLGAILPKIRAWAVAKTGLFRFRENRLSDSEIEN
jgi:peptidoglycan/LPS O-acetylase OafA/YrhL